MPTGLTVPADMTANMHGARSVHLKIPLTDSGSTSLVVSAHTATLTKKAKAHPGQAWVTSITPRQLTLKPHHQGFFTVIITAPAGARGPVWTNVIFAAGPAGHGQVRLAAAVGGTIRIVHPGTRVSAHVHHATLPASPSGSSSAALTVGIVAVVLLLAAAAALIARHRRKTAR